MSPCHTDVTIPHFTLIRHYDLRQLLGSYNPRGPYGKSYWFYIVLILHHNCSTLCSTLCSYRYNISITIETGVPPELCLILFCVWESIGFSTRTKSQGNSCSCHWSWQFEVCYCSLIILWLYGGIYWLGAVFRTIIHQV